MGSFLNPSSAQERNTAQSIPNRNYYLLNNSVLTQGNAECILFNIVDSRKLITTTTLGIDTTVIHTKQSFITQYLQLNYGLFKKPMINVGLDVLYTFSNIDQRTEAPKTSANDGSTLEHGIQSIGPRLRWLPAPRIPELSFQTALHFPANDLSKRQRFGFDRLYWVNQFFFFQSFLKFTWQIQADVGIFFKNEDRRQTTYAFSGYSYLFYPILTNSLYAFGNILYNTNQEESIKGGWREVSRTWGAGVGIFWQIGDKGWSINGSYSMPFSYKLSSLTTDVKPGSWWRLSVGIRYAVQSLKLNRS
jgi:hypothetical protein